MDLSTDHLQTVLLCPELREHELIRYLKRLNEIFTLERQSLEAYPESRELVSAYTMFYMSTNIPKLSFILDKLPIELKEKMKASTFIDIGTGPGTYLWAWYDYFQGEVGNLYGIDKSTLMLEQARVCGDKLFEKKLSVTLTPSLPPLGSESKTLFFGHSLDEMGMAEGIKMIERLKPEHIIALGPGTTDYFKSSLDLREKLLAQGFELHYPCTHTKSCPLLMREGDWCHQIFHHVHDPSVERLSQLIERDRRTMPLIAQVYSNEKASKMASGTMVRFLGETKFSFDMQVCLNSGEEKKIEVLKKDLDKEQIKKWRKTDVGIQLEFEVLKQINAQTLRVRLISS